MAMTDEHTLDYDAVLDMLAEWEGRHVQVLVKDVATDPLVLLVVLQGRLGAVHMGRVGDAGTAAYRVGGEKAAWFALDARSFMGAFSFMGAYGLLAGQLHINGGSCAIQVDPDPDPLDWG